jgi:hypothetical protein
MKFFYKKIELKVAKKKIKNDAFLKETVFVGV